MAEGVCPYWVGYLLLSPLRKLFESPKKILGPFVKPGMTVLEPGPGMGFFTLPLAHMVGPTGKVIALDKQEKMLQKLHRRAESRSLADRIETRPAKADSLGIPDLQGKADLAVLIHMVHEHSNPENLLFEVFHSLRPGGRMLMKEPPGHVSGEELEQSYMLAEWAGFKREAPLGDGKAGMVFKKPGSKGGAAD